MKRTWTFAIAFIVAITLVGFVYVVTRPSPPLHETYRMSSGPVTNRLVPTLVSPAP